MNENNLDTNNQLSLENLNPKGKNTNISIKHTQNLSIISNLSYNIRNYGISQYQSATSLQNSIPSITIPKAQRFKSNNVNIDTDYNIESPSSKIKISIGYGKRLDLINNSIKDNPSPNKYNMKSFVDEMFSNKKKGLINKSVGVSPFNKKQNPGPGTYDLKTSWNNHPVSITQRRNIYYDQDIKRSHGISPQKYSPKKEVIEYIRFKKIGIGYGKRSWDLIGGVKTPGVGTYNIPSIFDKERRFKLSLS